jgi:hypothetical protein
MRLRLYYTNGELYTEAGIPLTQIAVATGLNDPNEATLPELLDSLIEQGYTSLYVALGRAPRRGRKVKHAKRARRAVARPVA